MLDAAGNEWYTTVSAEFPEFEIDSKYNYEYQEEIYWDI